MIFFLTKICSGLLIRGMKRRPWILIVLAFGHGVAPFFNLIFDALWAGVPFLHYVQLFFMPHNFSKHWFHFLAPMIAGGMIYLCRKWSFLVYVTIMVALAFVSYASYSTRWDLYNPTPLILAYVLNIGFVTYFFLPAVRNVYFDPRLRWWETSPRYQTQIDCSFLIGSESFPGNIGNFSQSGLFIKSERVPDDHSIIRLEFAFENLQCQFQGQVIHHAKLLSKGFGVQFIHNPQSKKSAKMIADRLHLQGLLQPNRNFGHEDTFRWWIRQVMKTGQGLMPIKSAARAPQTSNTSTNSISSGSETKN